DLFAIWWERHRDHPIVAGTRMAGFVLTLQAPVGRWGVATYALQKTDGAEDHRDHRGHRVTDAPYAPYADGGQRSNGHTTDASPGIEITFDRTPGGKRSEDLARRFVAVDFDPRTEDPEARPFTTDIRIEVT